MGRIIERLLIELNEIIYEQLKYNLVTLRPVFALSNILKDNEYEFIQ